MPHQNISYRDSGWFKLHVSPLVKGITFCRLATKRPRELTKRSTLEVGLLTREMLLSIRESKRESRRRKRGVNLVISKLPGTPSLLVSRALWRRMDSPRSSRERSHPLNERLAQPFIKLYIWVEYIRPLFGPVVSQHLAEPTHPNNQQSAMCYVQFLIDLYETGGRGKKEWKHRQVSRQSSVLCSHSISHRDSLWPTRHYVMSLNLPPRG